MIPIHHLTDRVWLYGPGAWDGPPLSRGADEYGRLTLVLRLPGERALVWAYRTCRCADCAEVRGQTAQGEADLARVCAFYGVDEQAAWDLPGEDWNRALAA